MTLTGVPDALLRMKDGSLTILHFKTAPFTPAQDALMPVYEVQLNAYGLIAGLRSLGPVKTLALVYTEPRTSLADADPIAVGRPDGFVMGFEAKVHQLAYTPGKIGPLLLRAGSIVHEPKAPLGRAECAECAKVGKLALAAGYVREPQGANGAHVR